MDTKEAIFMTRGDGENSYAQHSCLTEMYEILYIQRILSILHQKVNAVTKPLLENAVQSLFSKGFHVHGVLNIADLGCAAGPNAFSVISTVKETVEMKSRELNYQTPELQFYLNDLPGNDFNTLFRGLSYENSFFLAGVPGSFHERLFPRKSLHLVHSSYGVHWLSQGLIEEEKLDSFNVPYYTPSAKEVQDVVEREGSFAVEHIDSFAVCVEGNLFNIGETFAKRIRAFTASVVAHHFGEELMRKIYDKLTKLLVEDSSIQAEPTVTVVVVLNKKL